MGDVWLARHFHLGHSVAIKILRAELLTARARKVFEREAQNLARLQSPHVVRIVDSGVGINGQPFIATEYLDGCDLWNYLQTEGPLPWPTAIEIGLQILSALAEAHAAGIVHRDLKPGNVFVQRTAGETPWVKLLDFGLSKLVDPAAEPDADSLLPGLKGSPRYMAPEQIDGQMTSTALDIYSMGAVLYCMLAGVPPFDGDVADVLVAQRYELPRLLSERGVDLPEPLEALIMRCLHKNPDVRPSSAEVLAELLSKCRTDGSGRTARMPTGEASPVPVPSQPETPPELTLVERPARTTEAVRPLPAAPIEPEDPAPAESKLQAQVDRARAGWARLADEMTPLVKWSLAGLFCLIVGLLVWRQLRGEIVEPPPADDPDPVAFEPTSKAPPSVRPRMLSSQSPASRAAMVRLRTNRSVTVVGADGETVYCESATVCWVPAEGDVQLKVRRRVVRVVSEATLLEKAGGTLRLQL